MIRTTKYLADLRKAVEAKQRELDLIKDKITVATSEQRIVCPNCGKHPTLAESTYIQTYWYVEPYSCSAGDYWKEGEGRFRCPKCKTITRLYNHPSVVDLKKYFGTQERLNK